MVDEVCRLVGPEKKETILDACCGSGLFPFFWHLVPGGWWALKSTKNPSGMRASMPKGTAFKTRSLFAAILKMS